MSLEVLKKLAGAEEIVDPRATNIITREQGTNLNTAMFNESPDDEKYFLTDDHGRELVSNYAGGVGHIHCWALVPDTSPENQGGTPFENFQEAMVLRDQAENTWLFMERLEKVRRTGGTPL